MTEEKKKKITEEERELAGKEANSRDHIDNNGEQDDGDIPVSATEEKKKKIKKDKKEEEIKELQSKIEVLSDKHLRLQAEFDNYRRRTIREKADLVKTAGELVIKDILPIIDDFERAINSMNEISDDDAGKQGILLIYSKFKDFLRQNNVKEIEALHKDFDVDLHEALTKIKAPEEELKGKIVEVIQKGYILNDKVIRFAKVVVGE